jgi:hypothetical protein
MQYTVKIFNHVKLYLTIFNHVLIFSGLEKLIILFECCHLYSFLRNTVSFSALPLHYFSKRALHDGRLGGGHHVLDFLERWFLSYFWSHATKGLRTSWQGRRLIIIFEGIEAWINNHFVLICVIYTIFCLKNFIWNFWRRRTRRQRRRQWGVLIASRERRSGRVRRNRLF